MTSQSKDNDLKNSTIADQIPPDCFMLEGVGWLLMLMMKTMIKNDDEIDEKRNDD